MSLADMIPTLDDKALATLRDNARRIEADGGARQQQALEALPLIEAELAARLALKPPKKTAAKKPAKPKVAKAKTAKAAKAEAEAAEAEAAEAEPAEAEAD